MDTSGRSSRVSVVFLASILRRPFHS
jgi:hypothetical protein